MTLSLSEKSAIVEPDGRATSFRYDEHRRLVAVTHPDGDTTTYTYNSDDRLSIVDDRGVVHRYRYDTAGRLTRAEHGHAPARIYRYDDKGRLAMARTGAVTTGYQWQGDTLTVSCACDGVTVAAELDYDTAGRLRRLGVAGSELRYSWDGEGRFAGVETAGQAIACAEYGDGVVRLRLGNGLVESRTHDPVDHRPLALTVTAGEREIFARRYDYRSDGRLACDGARRYSYDSAGRLAAAEGIDGQRFHYRYDVLGSRVTGTDRLVHDTRGRLVARGEVGFRYDDADRLVEARRDGVTVARMAYDHAGRLVRAVLPGRVERYLYSLDGTLLAVTDDHGGVVRIPVRTPLGVLAELCRDGIRYTHAEHTGTVRMITDTSGAVLALPECGPYGEEPSTPDSVFHGRPYVPELGLYEFGSRWYDPALGRFLTPDSHTGRPDDARLVHPFGTGRRQVAERAEWLPAWLGKPHERNGFAFCCGDPVNRFDPDGHWSFGWLLLSLLGAIWTLPNTLLGVLLEITCLATEPIRWILSALGRAQDWQPVGFDTATSSRLNAFALVFVGGWMGTLLAARSFGGITFGNVFFVNRNAADPTLYEHELRHTNQYGWFGPLFLVVYLLDFLAHGYEGSLLELDAQVEARP